MKKDKFEDLPLFEMLVDESDKSGIRLISIVDKPAIEMKGVAFSKDGIVKEYQFKADEDKQIIVGPTMIPDIRIPRKDANGNKYNVFFSKETIYKLVQKFNSSGDNRRINVDHSKQMVNGYILEDWIVEDEYYDKCKLYGFNVPVGTHMVKIKIEDENFWKTQVKELGKFGFSIEGILGERPVNYSIDSIIDGLSYEDIISLLKSNDKK